MPLSSHDRLGAFEVVALLGAGGMGEVYRARDTRLDREVALKVLPAATLGDETARARLLREARLASKLNHPHVCTIYEVGEADGRVYIAMELIGGEPLSALAGAGALPTEQVLRYGLQVADALAHAHERGIIHRDLKTANVVITREGRAKVLDFGLAKQVPGEEWATAVTASHDAFTAPGMVAGTLAYMAPEQLRGLPADARSDIWALGIVLYEMAAGNRPFKGRTGFEVSSAILGQAPPPLPPTVPAPLTAVIERCLAKEPAQRYQRAGEVRAALETVQSGGAVLRQPTRSARSRWRWAGGVAALAVLVALLAVLDIGGARSRLLGGTSGAFRLAVLPFVNQTGDPEQEYLREGQPAVMIAKLGRLDPKRLEVIARTSVMRYKKSNTPIDQIGRELQVDYVLEGSVRRGGSRIRISAVLIQVRGQAQLWTDSYQREMSDILALQSDVARQVASALALKLLPADQARLATARRVNPEAYEAYLKGTHARQALNKGGFETAERYFTLALEKDPIYAAAWAGLARVWTGRQQMGVTPPREAFREAKAAALKALALDEAEWEAHRALAGILTWGDWDWPAAEQKWKQILELNPNNAEALQGYSHFLMHVGRSDEAMTSIERALVLDPFSVRNQSFYAIDLVYTRRFDDAITAARAALRLQPDAPVAMNALYQALFLKGRYDEALALDRERYAGDGELREALERGSAEAGYRGAQRRLVDVWAARNGKPGGPRAWDLALRCLYAGDRERALQWLEKAYEEGDGNMPYIGMPIYDSLRSDPRFQDLLRRMKLPH